MYKDLEAHIPSKSLDIRGKAVHMCCYVIADHADNPGSGAYGDSTYLLKSMLDAKLTNAAFGTLYDPIAAQTLAQAGVGAEVSLFVGGKTDPRFGPPYICYWARPRDHGWAVSGPWHLR